MKSYRNNQDPLQYALFKAAKVSHIKLMREFIEAGADPFAQDAENRDAIFYVKLYDSVVADMLFAELNKAKETENA